jgi:hypothetical protein
MYCKEPKKKRFMTYKRDEITFLFQPFNVFLAFFLHVPLLLAKETSILIAF